MKFRKISQFFVYISVCIVFFAGVSSVQATQPEAGEEMLFTTSTMPDALILLDLSGSMQWTPAGRDMYISPAQLCGSNVAYYAISGAGHTKPCKADPYGSSSSYDAANYDMGTPRYGDASCAGPFYFNSGTGHTTNCRRHEIVKRAIFDILDDNNDNTINSADEASLAVRLGYMRFYDCSSDDTGGSYTGGCNQIPGSSSSSRRYIGSKYSQIYCNSNSSCIVTDTGSYAVGGADASGGTPLASAQLEAKLYLDAHKAADTYAACRQKFVILVSDGADTFVCSGGGGETAADMYKRRRESVARAKALADAGYKVFVIGVGVSMPDYLKNTLNWMAYYGGTANPTVMSSGNTSDYNISSGCDISTDPVTNPTACCDLATNPTACFPSGITSCMTSTTTGTCDGTSTSCFAQSNDPGSAALSGYAFIVSDAAQMTASLKVAMNLIHQATFSFTQASVQASRTLDENYLYEASFDPISNDPFWHGHLKKYQILPDGSIGSMLVDAGDVLRTASADSRTMKTLISGALTSFTNTIDPSYFGYASGDTDSRNAVVGYFRGESAYDADKLGVNVYKLGDIFRSSPITVGTPSVFYDDNRDMNYSYVCSGNPNNINAFAKHRCDHPRSSVNGYRIIVAGANDGQLHAFKTADMSEAWSFIPPNLLSKLNNISHSTEPANKTHAFFVDGPIMVADVWLGSGDGTSKNNTDWHSLLVMAEGRGSSPNLWSSSSTCDSGFNPVWSAGYPYYCGYYALDVTSSLSPAFLWHLGGTSTLLNSVTQAPYLADPWSKMMPGRVLIGGQERWVGFIGAGYNASDCAGGGACDSRGKGFFVVDLRDGSVLKSFTLNGDTRMKYSLPATPAGVDADNDGFIDTVYIGDLGGNIWRFKLCTRADGTGCNQNSWQSTLLYDSSSGVIRPIYTMPAAAIDGVGNLWIYWGTGDKSDPTASNAQEKLYALKDNDRTTTYRINDMDNITSTGATYDNTNSTNDGYYIDITGMGEKILADPIVFGGVVYFSTYTPPENKPCEQSGVASLYGIKYTSGAGAFPGGARSISIGQGIPSSPVVSTAQGASTSDIYITTSSGGVGRVPFNPPGGGLRTDMLFWRDQRLQ